MDEIGAKILLSLANKTMPTVMLFILIFTYFLVMLIIFIRARANFIIIFNPKVNKNIFIGFWGGLILLVLFYYSFFASTVWDINYYPKWFADFSNMIIKFLEKIGLVIPD